MSFEGELVEAVAGARNCALNLAAVSEGESVLIVMRNSSDMRIAQALAAACREVGAKVHVIVVEDPSGRSATLTPVLRDSMLAADVIFGNVRIDHGFARAAGARFVGLYTKDLDGFTGPGARLPAEIVFKICELAERQWKSGRTITVTLPLGTTLTARIVKASYAFGHVTAPLRSGEFANWSGGFGGLCLWPEWTANGEVYFDTVATFSGRTRTPLKWTVRDGRVVRFEGEERHVEFLEAQVKAGGKDADHFGEIMIGLCPTARIQFTGMYNGLYMETERHAGVMHCAVGSSTDLEDDEGRPKAPSVRPSIHFDCMNIRPTIRIDGELSVDDGRLTVLDHPEVQELAKRHGVTF